MENLAVEWLEEKIKEYAIDLDILNYVVQAKEMEKEQRETLLKYIEEVRDLCGKLRFPTEEELRELTIKADVILETFKEGEQ
jgi:hypothetical protein